MNISIYAPEVMGYNNSIGRLKQLIEDKCKSLKMNIKIERNDCLVIYYKSLPWCVCSVILQENEDYIIIWRQLKYDKERLLPLLDSSGNGIVKCISIIYELIDIYKESRINYIQEIGAFNRQRILDNLL